MSADPGASHKRKGRPSSETVDLLGDAHRTLRAELRDCLGELRPPAVDSATLTIGDPMPPARPDLAGRARLVDLIGKLMGLLGTEIVEAPPASDPTAPRRRRGGRIDYGGA